MKARSISRRTSFEERYASPALAFENLPLAGAGVHQQSERERQVVVTHEVGDGLGAAVFLHGEVVMSLPDLSRTIATRLTTFTSTENPPAARQRLRRDNIANDHMPETGCNTSIHHQKASDWAES
jgi:hypothetical protein